MTVPMIVGRPTSNIKDVHKEAIFSECVGILTAEIAELKEKLKQYERQGGTINMANSWKAKYRNALAEANQRLIDAGLEPVRIRKNESCERHEEDGSTT
jgi:hypothetical protein